MRSKFMPWADLAPEFRQLEEARAQIKLLQEALQTEKEKQRDKSITGASTSVISLFNPSSFETSLSSFRWHLAYCVPNSRVDSIFDFDAFSHQLSYSVRPLYPPETTRLIQIEWPSHLMIQQSIEYFSTNRLYAIFPMVDVDSLAVLLQSHSFDHDGRNFDVASRACLVALTAFITRIRHHETAFAHANPNAYVQAVLSLIPELIRHHTNVRTLEALLILVPELLMSMAVRVLCNLGGYKTKADSQEFCEIQNPKHLRALFWLLYSLDKEMSLRKCQPPLINDADCDLDLPVNYVSVSSDHQFFEYQLSLNELLFPTDLRLALLKSKIYQQLYSYSSLNKPEATRIQLIRELDQELVELKSQFPGVCQPEGYVSGGIPDFLLHDLSLRGINIHLEYYHCLAKIHGASTIGITSVPKAVSPPSSSMELCYEASRSTLIYLSRARHLIMPETFWIYAQFIMTAAIALYQRLTAKPTEVHSRQDIRLLEDVLGIFRQLRQADDGHRFPPFAITEALVEQLILSVKSS
ncbi:hypothetical protein N7462_005436 [Penicillium macrosclerotiorum]|uniref:uncharacterized protein n=1 Tax=Penicillium macrosclerotiorum TaxID=303699 RepID=UPI00254832F3|nr:uncharacterized protein N7462_005436 [Penicillium macrosclerotiorum]KAJ5682271.1 hypothetical protein N7462_005436 [Penicillium macrosclerotiorum]